MREKLNVVELDRRTVVVRNESTRLRDERDRLDRQLHSALDQKRRAWEQGFAAAMTVVAEKNERKYARGTSDFGPEEITASYPIIDPTTIEAD